MSVQRYKGINADGFESLKNTDYLKLEDTRHTDANVSLMNFQLITFLHSDLYSMKS